VTDTQQACQVSSCFSTLEHRASYESMPVDSISTYHLDLFSSPSVCCKFLPYHSPPAVYQFSSSCTWEFQKPCFSMAEESLNVCPIHFHLCSLICTTIGSLHATPFGNYTCLHFIKKIVFLHNAIITMIV